MVRGVRNSDGQRDSLRADAIARILAASMQLGLQLPPAAPGQLVDFVELLEKWNSTYNLSALRSREQMLVGHVMDCLAAAAKLPLARFESANPGRPVRIVDVGSGAGLPAIVWAIALGERVAITSVDSVQKKVAFQRQARAELGLKNLQAEHARIEQLQPPQRFDIVSARAFAALSDLVRLTRHLIGPGGCWATMKAAGVRDELAALPPDVRVRVITALEVPGLDAGRRNLVILEPSPTH